MSVTDDQLTTSPGATSPVVEELEFETSRFGRVRITPDRMLAFPRGLVGLPHLRSFTLLHHNESQESPFFWLQSLDDPQLAFVICDPRAFFPDYVVPVPGDEQQLLGIEDPDEALVCVILVVPSDPREITANLRGPVVINLERRIGLQMVLSGEEFPVRARLFPAAPIQPDTSTAGVPATSEGGAGC